MPQLLYLRQADMDGQNDTRLYNPSTADTEETDKNVTIDYLMYRKATKTGRRMKSATKR